MQQHHNQLLKSSFTRLPPWARWRGRSALSLNLKRRWPHYPVQYQRADDHECCDQNSRHSRPPGNIRLNDAKLHEIAGRSWAPLDRFRGRGNRPSEHACGVAFSCGRARRALWPGPGHVSRFAGKRTAHLGKVASRPRRAAAIGGGPSPVPRHRAAARVQAERAEQGPEAPNPKYRAGRRTQANY
jgi:hypothetical protein